MSNFMERFALTNKVAIITGSGKGIGKATALAFADAGAHVVCTARTQADVEKTAEMIRAKGVRALAVVCDITKTESLENLVAETLKEFGKIDILVNNAGGYYPPEPAIEMSEARFEEVLRFNLTSSFLLTQMVVKKMIKNPDGGSVVNISSAASNMPLKAFAPYGAAKAGLNQMTNILAAEFAPKVRVNGIIVGLVATPATEGITADAAIEQHAIANIPMGRLGLPDDIAAGIVFLASPAASWLTGKMLQIDGGAVEAPLNFPIPPL